jgi:hypothetical protein
MTPLDPNSPFFRAPRGYSGFYGNTGTHSSVCPSPRYHVNFEIKDLKKALISAAKRNFAVWETGRCKGL